MPKSVLDERLAEIDSRLRSIQSGLVESEPRAEPSQRIAPVLPARVELPPLVEVPRPASVAAEPPAPAEPPASVAAAPPAPVAAAPPALEEPTAPAAPDLPPWAAELTAQLRGLSQQLALLSGASAAELAVVAGPLANTGALREFERSLAALPGVRAVELRGFEGGDRAILDVDLQPNP